jgi:hypothetical protein
MSYYTLSNLHPFYSSPGSGCFAGFEGTLDFNVLYSGLWTPSLSSYGFGGRRISGFSSCQS